MKLQGLDYLVVGDVTGYGKTLIELHKQAPHLKLIGLGDIIDRGPNSKLALDYFIDNDFKSVMGNHDHFMWWHKHRNDPGVNKNLYPWDCWAWNGGGPTARSFGFQDLSYFECDLVPQKYWDFLDNLPLKIEVEDKFVLTHAPIGIGNRNFFDFNVMNKDEHVLDRSALWNRMGPYPAKNGHEYQGKIQLYGHNSSKGVLWHMEKLPQGQYKTELPQGFGECFAICLDTWREGYLSGLDLSTMKLYKQPLVD